MKKRSLAILITFGALGNAPAFALDNIVCSTVPSCSAMGYTNKGSCYNGYIACPFDKTLKHCDTEADSNDFKFSLPSSSSGWSVPSSYAGRFIVGYGSSYCGLSSTTTTASDQVGKHSHSAGKADGVNYYSASYKRADGGNHSFYSSITSKYYSITSSATGDKETRPYNYAVNLYKYTSPTAVSGTQSEANFNPDVVPDCSELGYVDRKENCPGSFVRCPFDETDNNETAVMCDMQAKAGEIKFSLNPSDHDGWLLCNGASLSSKGSAYTYSELASILEEAGFGSKLPDYRGAFLRVKGSYTTNKASSTTYNTVQYDSFGSHTHTATFSGETQNGSDSRNIEGSGKNRPEYWPLRASKTYTTTISHAGSETRPPNYAAYLFIYSGKLNVTNCRATYKYTCTASSTTHISGGSGTACNGKYTACKCTSGYSWNATTGACKIVCGSQYNLDSCPSNAVCTKCGGKYYWDGTCKSGYVSKDEWSGCYGRTHPAGCYTCSTICSNEQNYCDYENGCNQFGDSSIECSLAETAYQNCMSSCNR